MGHYDFYKDLAVAQKTELEVANMLVNKSPNKVEILEFNDDYRYDIKLNYNGLDVTLEVKEDLMASKTGNIAVEYSSRGNPSGIAKSPATHWLYVLREMKLNSTYYVLFKTDELRDLIQNPNYRHVSGGDNRTSRLVLVPLADFTTAGQVIT